MGQHNACELISSDVSFLSECIEIRRNNQTILSISIDGTQWLNNGPRILKLGSHDTADWFTAPSIPGSWYNFSVLLYGTDGQLLEAQTSDNCSNIGGEDLHLPNITISNGRDSQLN